MSPIQVALRGLTPEQVLQEAAAYGVDLSLIDSNLRRTVEQRLRALDENVTFLREAHRSAMRARGLEPLW